MAKQIQSITDLIPDAANANKGTERGRYAVEASLRETGAGRSIVVDKDGRIIAGNKTLEAWADISGEIEIVKTDGKKLIVVQREDLDLSDVEGLARKLAYYDNRAGQLGLEWDAEQLFSDLNAGVDLSGMFFDDEIADILATIDGYEKETAGEDPGADVSKADELQAKWQVQLGDLWQLGDHRLICGDCTDEVTVARVMGGEKADLVASDPPYGVEYEGKTADALKVLNDGKDGLLDLLTNSLQRAFDMCKPGACWYIAAPPGPQFYDFATVLLSLGVWRQTLVWVKNTMVLGHSDYHYKHEVIFYGWKPGAAHQAPPDRTQTSVWEFDKPSASRLHPTMKPVELYEKAIENSTDKDAIVYEPFSGSGTTIIACEQLGRKCRAVELHPPYVSVALQRWADMTGKTPTRIT